MTTNGIGRMRSNLSCPDRDPGRGSREEGLLDVAAAGHLAFGQALGLGQRVID